MGTLLTKRLALILATVLAMAAAFAAPAHAAPAPGSPVAAPASAAQASPAAEDATPGLQPPPATKAGVPAGKEDAVPVPAKAPPKKAPPKPLPPQVAYRLDVLTPSVLPCEPVLTRFTWRNEGDKAVEFDDDHPLLLLVQGEDDAAPPRRFWVARRVRVDETISLGPGEETTRTVPVVVGWPPSAAKPPVEFILTQAGRWRVRLDGADDSGYKEVTVRAPAGEADLAARAMWTKDMAFSLVAGATAQEAQRDAIEKLVAAHPFSPYAGYGYWMLGECASHRGGRGNFLAAARWCEALLDRLPGFALREQTYSTLIDIYAVLTKGEWARETARDFAAEFPASAAVAALRAEHGPDFAGLGKVHDLPAATTEDPKAALEVLGADLVPAGPREVFQALWQAAAAGEYARAEGLLSRDFVGDQGPRWDYGPVLHAQRRGASAGRMRVVVAGAEMTDRYDRPASMPSGVERTWRGRLCVVTGHVTVAWQHAGGRTEGMDAAMAVWAFMEYPGGVWKAVSEIAQTRNYFVGGLGRAVMNRLPREFTTFEISDGRTKVRPYEIIRSRLGLTGKVVDARAQWINHTLVMTGPNREDAELRGVARLLLAPVAGKPGPEEWVERGVSMVFVLGPDGTLILKSVTVDAGRRQPTASLF